MPRPGSFIQLILPVFFLLITGNRAIAQGACPVNIGFENGNFTGWNCLDGTVNGSGVISMTPSQPVSGRHTIYKNTSPQVRDTFGLFPVNCPNGSGYSIKLGNSGAGAQAQNVSYTLTVPAGQNDYSIIYNYAVVLQNPPNDHQSYEQPQFTSRVFDLSTNKYLECGAFQFIAAPNLPGFKESTVEKNIYYKEWAPVTIKLTGYAGKTIRLEFTVNDCTKSVHFGYAYLDVDENCTTPITGNTYCNGSGAVVLKAPYGFKEYYWYDDNATLLGTGNTLSLNPPPPGNTRFTLQIIPFPGQGCQDTLHTTIVASNDFMKLKTVDSVAGCPSPGVDITLAAITAGSTAGLSLSYFTDSTQSLFLSDPSSVSRSGTYYIKAISSSGCTEIRPVKVFIKSPPALNISSPSPVCAPGMVDLTAAAVTAGSEAGLSYSYFRDTLATQTLQTPGAVTQAGKYFIKATNTTGCTTVKPVMADISTAPNIVVTDLNSCNDLLLSAVNPTAGSDPTVKFSYWQDAAATISLSSALVFKATTTFYVKATAAAGCSIVKPINVVIRGFPLFVVTDPPPTTRPATVDLATTVQANSSWNYSYWLDDNATKTLPLPHEVALSGRYYIKAVDVYGCGTLNAVNVIIIDPPVVAPNAFSPNADGVNDVWMIPILSFYADCTVEVFTRSGQTIYRSSGYTKPWDGKFNGKSLPADTYYYLIKLTSQKLPVAGSVTLLK